MKPFQSIYESVGEDKIRQLTHHFYQEVAKNPKLGSLYPEDLAPAENRLFLFLLQVFGRPQIYSEQIGHPRLKMRHFDWDIDESKRDRWLNSMFAAMDMLELDPNVRELKMGYFIKVAKRMINHA